MKLQLGPLSILIKSCMLATSLSFCHTAYSADISVIEPGPAMAAIQDFKDRASGLAVRALGLVGIRYRYGGNTPESGMDCSGLVRYVFKETWGTSLPRTSQEISQVGQHIEIHDLQPGDLVFYNTVRRAFSHVGIYLGDNKFIHSPARGGEVRVESMELTYWKKRFNGARRITDPEYDKNGPMPSQ